MLEHSNPRTHNTQHLWCEGFMICEYCRVLSIKWFIMMELWRNYIIATLINHLELNLSASYKNTHTHTNEREKKWNEIWNECHYTMPREHSIICSVAEFNLFWFFFLPLFVSSIQVTSDSVLSVCVCRYWNFMVIHSVSRWKSFIL